MGARSMKHPDWSNEHAALRKYLISWNDIPFYTLVTSLNAGLLPDKVYVWSEYQTVTYKDLARLIMLERDKLDAIDRSIIEAMEES